MSEPIIRVKIWVDDDSFEASFAIPVSASAEQITSFVKSWFGTMSEVLKMDGAVAAGAHGTAVVTGKKGLL